MQLESILLGRAIRLLHISSASKGRIYGLHLVRACEERYGFWQGPRTVDDFDLAKGVTFLHGHFQSRLVIDKFQVFQNGMLAEAKADTNECDAFLDEFVGWIQSEFGISLNEEPSSPRFYQSNLEIRGSFSLAEKLPKLNLIGREVSGKLHQYKQESADFELVGLAYAAGAGAPSILRFERKEGVPEAERLYFCAAPLRTADHLQIVEQLESILAG